MSEPFRLKSKQHSLTLATTPLAAMTSNPAEGAAAAAPEPEQEVPQPPYTEDSDISEGLKCYWQGCTSKSFYKWSRLIEHLRAQHGVKHSQISQSYLYMKGREQINDEQTKARLTRSQKKAAAKVNSEGGGKPKVKIDQKGRASGNNKVTADEIVESRGCKRRKPPQEAQAEEAHASAEDEAPAAEAEEEPDAATQWLAMRCWVQCDMEGAPLEPLAVASLAPHGSVPPDIVPVVDHKRQISLDGFMQPGMDPTIHQTVVAQAAGSSIIEGPRPEPSESSMDTMQMLHHIKNLLDPAKKHAWMRELPEVRVKQAYLMCTPPVAKGDDVGRASWPKEFNKHRVPLPDFESYLKKALNQKSGNFSKHCIGVGRLLGALEYSGRDASVEELASVETLVALYIKNEHKILIDMPLLGPVYSWSSNVWDGIDLYCRYQKSKIQHKLILDTCGHWTQYMNVMTALQEEFKGGCKKRCSEQETRNIRTKRAVDLASLKNLHSLPVLQQAVKTAYLTMASIEKKYTGAPNLPKKVRGLANACLAGAIGLDTFAGRKGEWEKLTYEYVMKMLWRTDCETLICREHKTSKIYGDLAKYISHGLKQCMLCYGRLPRPDDWILFVVPAKYGSDHVDLPSSFRTFCREFLPRGKGKSEPTYNLMRKWFHTVLMGLSDTKEKLKDLMKIVDAHSKKVQDRHYCLRDPEDDVALAKQLVKTIIGETVQWPTDEEVEAFMKTSPDLDALLCDAMNNGDEDAGEEPQASDSEYEDIELDWWEAAGDFFGIPAPNVPLQYDASEVIPVKDQAPDDEANAYEAPGTGSASSTPCPRKGKTHKRISDEKLALYEEYSDETGTSNRHMAAS